MSNTEKRRVLVPVSNPLGGIRTYMLYNLKLMQDNGFQFTFLAPEGKAFDEFQEDVKHWDGVEFISVPRIKRKFSLWQAVRKAVLTKRFSLIHSQGLRAGTEAEIGNFFTRVPHIITLHDVINPFNQIPGRFKFIKKLAIGFFSRRASIIVPVSQDCCDIYVENFPVWKKGPCKVNVIQNGISVSRFVESRDAFEKAGGESIRKTLNIPENAIIGGFFGRFMPEKGFHILLEAISELARRERFENLGDKFRLIATKDNYGYRNETIRSVAERPEVAKIVHFIEPVSNIAPILSQIDVLVMPSLWEACPILPMESLCLGVPVIGSDSLGLREVLRNTPSVCPPKENPIRLADALEAFIKNPAELKTAAKAFEPEAQKRFDVKIAAEKLLDLYRRCAAG